MKLLQILALLGQANRTTSEGMYDILREVMRRADSGINIGYAVRAMMLHIIFIQNRSLCCLVIALFGNLN